MQITKRAALSVVLSCFSFAAFAVEGNMPVAPVNDAQIASVLEAANFREADLGKLAQVKTKNSEVKRFADRMVWDHNQALTKVTQTVADAKINPADYEKTNEVKAAAEKAKASLEKLSGPAFDKAYVENQIKMQKDLLKTIDTQLLPSVKDAQLKTVVQNQRPKIEAHLKQAEELRGKL